MIKQLKPLLMINLHMYKYRLPLNKMIFLPQSQCLKMITLMYILLVSVADIYVDSCLLVLMLTCFTANILCSLSPFCIVLIIVAVVPPTL